MSAEQDQEERESHTETIDIIELESLPMVDDVQLAALCAALAHKPGYAFSEDADVILEWLTDHREDSSPHGRS